MRWSAFYYNRGFTAAGQLENPIQLDIDAKSQFQLTGEFGKGKLVLKEARVAAWWGVAATNQTFELRVTAFLRSSDLNISQNLLPTVGGGGPGTVVQWDRIVFTDRLPFRNKDNDILIPASFIVDLNFQPLFSAPAQANLDSVDCFVNIGYDIV